MKFIPCNFCRWRLGHSPDCATRKGDLATYMWLQFWLRVDKGPGCWNWAARKNYRGYGMFKVAGRRAERAHRFIYEFLNGPLDKSLVVMHLCDNPACVRPDHLMAGTHTDNMRDSVRKERAARHRRTHCKHGHEFTPENTYYQKCGSVMVRLCKACHRRMQLEYTTRKREEATCL